MEELVGGETGVRPMRRIDEDMVGAYEVGC